MVIQSDKKGLAVLDKIRIIGLTIVVFEWFLHRTKSGDIIINACDSSKDKAWVGWLKQWMQKFKKDAPPTCSVLGCNKPATTGAHVRLLRGRQEFATIYIVPMCTGCNNRQGKGSSPPPKMPARPKVELMESNLHNVCRYRCRNFCRYKVKREKWWFRLRKKLLHRKKRK